MNEAITNQGDRVEMDRGQVVFKDGEDGRLYNLKNKDRNKCKYQYPSTTTIQEMILDLEGKQYIKNWNDRVYNSEELLKWYQARGELAHEYTYKRLYKKNNKNYKVDMNGIERAIKKLSKINIKYFKDNKYNKKELLDRLFDKKEDFKYYSKFDSSTLYAIYSAKVISEGLSRLINKDMKKIIFVENYVLHKKYGYAGQLDLLYVDKDNNLCLTDLKTSGGIRDKYQYQLTAYYESLPIHNIKREIKEEHNININKVKLQIARGNIDKKHNNDKKEFHFYTDDKFDLTRDQASVKFFSSLKKFREEKLPVQEFKY